MTSTHNAHGLRRACLAAVYGGLLPLVTLTAVAGESAPQPVDSATVTAPLDPQRHQTVVQFGDLNLDDPRGMATLASRIRRAVREVCPTQATRDLAQIQANKECRRLALESTNAALERRAPGLGAGMIAAVNR